MPPIFFALIASIGFAVGDIYGTITSRKIGGYSSVFWRIVFYVSVLALYLPTQTNYFQKLTPELLFYNIVLGLFLIVGTVAFYEGLKVGNAPVVGTISSCFAAISVIISIIFLNEEVSSVQLLTILLIFAGLVISTLDFEKLKKSKIQFDKGIFLAFVAMVGWGIYYAFVKILIGEIGWFLPTYITWLMFLPLIFVWLKILKFRLVKPTKKGALIPLVIGEIFLASAEFSYNIGLSKGLIAVVTPIAGSYPVLFVILAFFIFKDKITKQQILGIVITLLGIVMLSFFSS